MAAEDALPMSEEDKMAAEWAAALAESKTSGSPGTEVASDCLLYTSPSPRD